MTLSAICAKHAARLSGHECPFYAGQKVVCDDGKTMHVTEYQLVPFLDMWRWRAVGEIRHTGGKVSKTAGVSHSAAFKIHRKPRK